jgi:hypothetical protein
VPLAQQHIGGRDVQLEHAGLITDLEGLNCPIGTGLSRQRNIDRGHGGLPVADELREFLEPVDVWLWVLRLGGVDVGLLASASERDIRAFPGRLLGDDPMGSGGPCMPSASHSSPTIRISGGSFSSS